MGTDDFDDLSSFLKLARIGLSTNLFSSSISVKNLSSFYVGVGLSISLQRPSFCTLEVLYKHLPKLGLISGRPEVTESSPTIKTIVVLKI